MLSTRHSVELGTLACLVSLLASFGCSKTERTYDDDPVEGGTTSASSSGGKSSAGGGSNKGGSTNTSSASSDDDDDDDDDSAAGGSSSSGGASSNSAGNGGTTSSGGASSDSTGNGGASTSEGGAANGGASSDNTGNGGTASSGGSSAEVTDNGGAAASGGASSESIGGAASGGSGSTPACNDGYTGSDCSQCVVYVDGSKVVETPTGLSWSSPVTTVQEGIDLAGKRLSTESLSNCEVWVATGTYYPTEDASGNAASTSRSAVITLTSGVSLYGGFKGSESARDDRSIATYETILSGDILKTPDDVTDNVYRVVYAPDGSLIDGFTITGAYVNNFDGETATSGGGLYTDGSPTISNCNFASNRATYGGGIYVDQGSPVISNCTFTSNYSDHGNYGGGALGGQAANVTLSQCTFTDNTCNGGGCGINFEGGTLTLVDCMFEGNYGNYDGGAIRIGASTVATVTNSTFKANGQSSTGGGAAISAVSSTLYVWSSVFWKNSGSVIYTSGDGTTADVINSTFYGNTSSNVVVVDTGSVTIANSIIWGNTCDTTTCLSGSPTVTYSDIQAEVTNTGNISESPDFNDTSGGDFTLLSGSPCIDKGSSDAAPTLDKAGNPRVGTADMGAYEYQSSS